MVKTLLLVTFLLVCCCTYSQDAGESTVLSGQSGLSTEDLQLSTTIEFIPNKGQFIDTKGKTRHDIRYLALDGPVKVYLRYTGFSYVINTKRNPKLAPGYKDDDDDDDDNHEGTRKLKKELPGYKFGDEKDTSRTCRIDMDFVSALKPQCIESVPSEGYLNYYFPQCADGITNVKAFHNIVYKSIYRDIDVSYKSTYGKGFKYDIIVNPGGNPAQIRMKYTGAEKVEIKDGKLLLTAFTGKMEERIPKIYQEINGQKVVVKGEYVLLHQGKDSLDGTVVGIKLATYDLQLPLIIDPWWVTYCGGSGGDIGYSVALDNAGNTLVTGSTSSTNFPVSVGAFQSSLIGGGNVFVIKFDTKGNRLWATYYGGNSDIGYGITADINNNVFVTGATASFNFPVSVGAFQTILGGENAFIIKFNPNGIRVWGTYYGGNNVDVGYAITTDFSGNVAITGSTTSPDFPVSVGAFQTTLQGSNGNAFVVKFSPNGKRLWGTYFGGNAILTQMEFEPISNGDAGYGISTDAYGNIAFAGADCSTDFPVSPGCFQSSQGFGFIAELDPYGNRLWATYFGGSGAGSFYPQVITGCIVDKSNNVVVGGIDDYHSVIATPGVYQTSFTTGNGFAAKFNPAGNLIWTTWINIGNDEHGVMSLATDESNNVYTLQEPDPANNYPSPSCSFQSIPSNAEELYLIKLDSNAQYACSTYIGGILYDTRSDLPGTAIAARNGRMACVTYTGGAIPVTPGAFQSIDPTLLQFVPAVFNLCNFGCGDTTAPVLTISKIKVTIPDTCLGYVGFTAHAEAPCDSVGAVYEWSFQGGEPSVAIGPIISNVVFSTPGEHTVKLKYIACSADSITQTFNVISGFHDSLAVVNPAKCEGKGKATVYPADGISPYTYWWSNGKTTQSDTGLATGSYTCVVSDKNGCRDTLAFQIVNPTTPSFITKPKFDTGFCIGGSATLLVSGGSNFTWVPAAGLSCTHCPNPLATPTTTMVYTVTGTDTVGCTDSVSIRINVNAVPVFSLLNKTPASCGSYSLIKAISSDSTKNWIWKWSPSTTLIDLDSNYFESYPPAQITYTVTASNGYCSRSDTITVGAFVKTFPIHIKATPDTFCKGAIISLVSYSANRPKEWLWSPVSGLSCNDCDSNSLNTSPILVHGTTYTVALVVQDSMGCISNDTVTLTIAPPILAGISIPPKICPGDSLTLLASGGNNYLWNTGSVDSIITVYPTITTTYRVLVTNSYDCSAKASRTVIVDAPTLFACCDSTILLGSNATLYADSSVTYKWEPSTGISCDTCAEVIVSPTVTTTYTVTGKDNMGCETEKIITIEVNTCGSFFVPNVFTPNGDGVNDEFVINTGEVKSYSIVIYNRWGREMYSSTDPTKYWNGNTENGEKACDGIYYYIITSACRDTIYDKNGYVQLIR